MSRYTLAGEGSKGAAMDVKQHRIEGAGGVGLSVREAGPEGAPAILLIHGWSQAALCWSKQMRGPLAERFRLVAPDLRGHGSSDKPADPALYRDSALWAADMHVVVETLGLGAPVLVGWSMGGRVLCDWLRHYGDGGLSGIVLTGCGARSGALADAEVMARRKPDVEAVGMYEVDLEAQLDAAIAFVKACVAAPLSKRDLAFMVGYNMLVPPGIRRAARLRDEDNRADLAAITCPAMVIQGAAERLCLTPMYEEVMATLPAQAQGLVYPGCGHAPFWEDAPRFDADLGAFAAGCFGMGAAA
ncbi:MAG: alpha/beta hydrolase [Pseudomonadota bacterium]